MSFESTGDRIVQRRNEFHPHSKIGSTKRGTEIREGWILKRSRLTEKDLEAFRQSILQEHKKKHYRVLTIATVICILLGTALYLLYSGF